MFWWMLLEETEEARERVRESLLDSWLLEGEEGEGEDEEGDEDEVEEEEEEIAAAFECSQALCWLSAAERENGCVTFDASFILASVSLSVVESFASSAFSVDCSFCSFSSSFFFSSFPSPLDSSSFVVFVFVFCFSELLCSLHSSF